MEVNAVRLDTVGVQKLRRRAGLRLRIEAAGMQPVEKLRLSGKRLRQFRRGIGMVFQSFNLVTRTSVIKNVLSACVPDMPFWRVLLGAFRREDKIRALESLDKVGILDTSTRSGL